MKEPIMKARLNTEEDSIEIPRPVWQDISKLSAHLSYIQYNPYKHSPRTTERVRKAMVEIMVDLINSIDTEADPV